ncbi:hypothetical protein ACWKSR_10640, partial [Campylobacter fetus subsp. venerealis]
FTVQAIKLAYAQALLVDGKSLEAAQEIHDVTGAQEILQDAYRTDLRPLLAETIRRSGGAIDPIGAFRKLKVRESLINERGLKSIASGL